jgi:hypothetical protein
LTYNINIIKKLKSLVLSLKHHLLWHQSQNTISSNPLSLSLSLSLSFYFLTLN